MIHKLIDIFGRKDSSKSENSKPSDVSDSVEETRISVVGSKSQNVNQTSASAKNELPHSAETTSESAENTSNSEYRDNISDYLRSTARSAGSRDDCFGCKMTASIMMTGSVIFAQVCMSKRKNQILNMVVDQRKRLVMLRIKYLQVLFWGGLSGFLLNEWYITREKEAIEERNQGYFKGYFKF